MEYLTFSWVDYFFFSVMLIGSSLVGIYFGFIKKGENTITNYFLGGKNMAVLPVTFSLVASSLSSLTLVGLPAEVYLYGIQYWMMWISWIIMGLSMNYIFLPVFHKLQLTTAYEYFEIRFNRKVRKLASAIYILTVIVSLPVFIYGPALAFNQVSGFNIHLTASVISCICIFYTSIGGLKAVIWADAFQFCCTICTLAAILVMGTLSVGGVSNIWQKAMLGERLNFFTMDPNLTVRSSFWSIVIGHIVIWLNLIGIHPAAVQRFLSVPTLKDSKRVLFMLVVLSIITKSIGCFSGLVVYAKYSECDPLQSGSIKSADQIMPYFVLDVASQSPGLSGIFVSGLLSTALSTLATSLNTVSGTIYEDFVSPFMSKSTAEGTANTIMKSIAVVVGVIVVLLVFVMEHLGTILQMSLSLNGVFTGPLLALFILGILFPMANSKGALIGAITSLLIMSIIVVQSQVLIWNGTMKPILKPMHTFGCNSSIPLGSKDNVLQDEPFWLYRISFYYYGPIGVVLSIVTSLVISWFTKIKQDTTISKECFSPYVHRFLQDQLVEKQHEQELQPLQKDENSNSNQNK